MKPTEPTLSATSPTKVDDLPDFSDADALADMRRRIEERDSTAADRLQALDAALDLRRMRKAAGFTQLDVATGLGIAQSGVAKIERDPSAVSVRRLKKYAGLIGYRVELVPLERGRRTLRIAP